MNRWKFVHPFTARFVGPTACGKTTFLQRVIEQRLIEPWPSRIYYFYGSNWQSKVFDNLETVHGVIFIKGFDDTIISENESMEKTLIICDDLVLEMKDSDSAANLFMRGSHHLNMSVILIEQSLFPKGRQSVAMKTNTHYTVIFKSPADAQGVATLARQMFPHKGGRFLIDAFHDCTRDPFSYLIVDSRQSTPDQLRLISKVTNEDGCPLIYVSKLKDAASSLKTFNEKIAGKQKEKAHTDQDQGESRAIRADHSKQRTQRDDPWRNRPDSPSPSAAAAATKRSIFD